MYTILHFSLYCHSEKDKHRFYYRFIILYLSHYDIRVLLFIYINLFLCFSQAFLFLFFLLLKYTNKNSGQCNDDEVIFVYLLFHVIFFVGNSEVRCTTCCPAGRLVAEPRPTPRNRTLALPSDSTL